MGVVVGVCCISFLDTTKKSEMLGRGCGCVVATFLKCRYLITKSVIAMVCN